MDEDRPSHTVLQSAILFVALIVIYAIYLQGIIDSSGTVLDSFSDLLWPVAKVGVMSGAPFAVVACVDRSWESEHAAPVALAAWLAVFGFFSWKLGSSCPAAFAFFFLPLAFSALVAHKVGALRHRFRTAS